MSNDLRSRVIRLAHQNPSLRPHLLPLLKQAAVHSLDLTWVEGMRKDFLTLLKNLPRVPDYETAHVLRDAFKKYRKHFDTVFFEGFLKKDLLYYSDLSEDWVEYYVKKLRGPAWQFSIDLSVPIGFADDYGTEGMQFAKFQQEYPGWKTKVQRKAQIFWKEMKEAVEGIKASGKSFQTSTPEDVKATVEGFRLILRGYESGEGEDWEAIKEGLRIYKRNAAARMPILDKLQLPMVIDFEASIDKGGTYNRDGTITFYASSASKGPKWVAHAMAHEMGHHLWQKYLSSGAKEFWDTAIRADIGDLDIQEVVDNWPGTAWAWEFPEVLGQKDPVLALQVDAASQNPMRSKELQKKEDFQDLLDRGIRTLKVPQTPITGYANKNTEEAFCEAIGLLVSYGPRALHETVRRWLDVVLPGKIKMASARLVASRFLTAGVRR